MLSFESYLLHYKVIAEYMVMTTIMSQALVYQLTTEDFEAERFVRDLSAQCVGAHELRFQRVRIQELANSTSILLKRNVYQNYIQFIETAKEISHLESEMYQLSQLLSDQRTLLNMLGSNRSPGIVLGKNFDVASQDFSISLFEKGESGVKLESTQTILENVEGAINFLEMPWRKCLHDGSLLELDTIDGTPLRRIHAYLFNDILMIASWLSNTNRRGPPKYRMQVAYDMKNSAIVNVKDVGNFKMAFKLLAFPDTRIFQCVTATKKKEWLEKYDQARRMNISQQFQSQVIHEGTSPEESNATPHMTLYNSNNTADKVENQDNIPNRLPEWLSEITENLDSCIAERHFEEAHTLFRQAKSFIDTQEDSNFDDLRLKLNDRVSLFVRVLTSELESSTEAKSLQSGGLKSARRAIRLLIDLNRSAQACQLYLKLCSVALKFRLKRVKKEGTTVSYIKQLSNTAFKSIVEISQEFVKSFPQSANCFSVFTTWCSYELKLLILNLMKQIFIRQVPLSTIVTAVSAIRDSCEQLTEVGVDFRFHLDDEFRTSIHRVLLDTQEKYVEAVKIRALEDDWKKNYVHTLENLQRLILEFDDLGVPLPETYSNNRNWISLTSNTLTFSRMYIGLLEDCLNIITPQILDTVKTVLISVLRVQLHHLQQSLFNTKLEVKRALVEENIQYFDDIIIPRSLELYETVTAHQWYGLMSLQDQMNRRLTVKEENPAIRISIPKYSNNEYI